MPAALCAPALPSPMAEREIDKRGLTVPRVLQAMQNYPPPLVLSGHAASLTPY